MRELIIIFSPENTALLICWIHLSDCAQPGAGQRKLTDLIQLDKFDLVFRYSETNDELASEAILWRGVHTHDAGATQPALSDDILKQVCYIVRVV